MSQRADAACAGLLIIHRADFMIPPSRRFSGQWQTSFVFQVLEMVLLTMHKHLLLKRARPRSSSLLADGPPTVRSDRVVVSISARVLFFSAYVMAAMQYGE